MIPNSIRKFIRSDLIGSSITVRNITTSSSVLVENQNKFSLPKRFDGIGTSNIWADYVQLGMQHKPLNLGQGFPDFAPPNYVTEALKNAALSNPVNHQYTRSTGHPRLVNAISTLYSQLLDRQINPQNEIVITFGASEALYLAIAGNIQPGDEVILIEPFFECYQTMVMMSGGKCRFVPLRTKNTDKDVVYSEDYVLDTEELEKAFNNKTKVIIFNTPNNPLGKVYSKAEMETIANLCKKWNVICISDEVYEWLAYKPHQHLRMTSLPGMWERTITMGSAGKVFNVTGWKTGWALGPEYLLNNLRVVNDLVKSCGNTPIQEAIALCFEKELQQLDSDDCYFYSLNRELHKKRDYMVKCLINSGMKPIVPQGGYFVLTDYSSWASQIDLSEEPDQYKDFRFTKWLIKNVGVMFLPNSVFYADKHKKIGENFVRVCFYKDNKYLEDVNKVLQKWKTK